MKDLFQYIIEETVPNKFRILSSNSYGELRILADTGVRYYYNGANPNIVAQLETLLKRSQYGTAWQILRQLELEKTI